MNAKKEKCPERGNVRRHKYKYYNEIIAQKGGAVK